jgi:transitional endoplasmic reticulum ATPase
MASDSVIRALQQAVEATPNDVPLRLHLAQLLEQSGRAEDALEQYSAIMRLEPNHREAWLGIIRTLRSLERYAQAERQLDAFLKVYPDDMEGELLKYSPPAISEPTETEIEEEQPEPLTHLGCTADWRPADFASFLRVQPTGVSFADVGGMEALKEQIRLMIIYPLQRPDLYAMYRKRAGGGVLMYGPPGCGKTLLARAIATECEMPMLYLGISEILSPWVGVSEQFLHEAFETARNCAPCVLFIDELDALGVRRTEAHHHARTLVSQLLEELDGFQSRNERVLILAATNSPWHVDPALLRPGRFDRVLFVPPPDLEARIEILKIHTRGRPLEPRFDFARIAQQLRYFSGADIAALCEHAAEEAIARALRTGKPEPLTTEQFLRLARAINPITLEWARTARNYATYANETGLYDAVAEWLTKERLMR